MNGWAKIVRPSGAFGHNPATPFNATFHAICCLARAISPRSMLLEGRRTRQSNAGNALATSAPGLMVRCVLVFHSGGFSGRDAARAWRRFAQHGEVEGNKCHHEHQRRKEHSESLKGNLFLRVTRRALCQGERKLALQVEDVDSCRCVGGVGGWVGIESGYGWER